MSIFKLRTLTPQEIQLLRLHNKQENREIFSEEDLTKLAKENGASFKIYDKAEKVLDEHKKRMNMPPSRNEMIQVCIPRWELQKILNENINPFIERNIAVEELLVKKGTITNAEVDAMVEKRRENARKAMIPTDEQIEKILETIEDTATRDQLREQIKKGEVAIKFSPGAANQGALEEGEDNEATVEQKLKTNDTVDAEVKHDI